jgi:hypothetical protein
LEVYRIPIVILFGCLRIADPYRDGLIYIVE